MLWLHLQTCLNVISVSALYHIYINSLHVDAILLGILLGLHQHYVFILLVVLIAPI